MSRSSEMATTGPLPFPFHLLSLLRAVRIPLSMLVSCELLRFAIAIVSSARLFKFANPDCNLDIANLKEVPAISATKFLSL